MSSRVIYLEPVRSDTMNADEFGTIEYLYPHGERGSRPSVFDTGNLAEQIGERLQDLAYVPNVDYVVMTGNYQAVIIFMMTVANLYGIANVLMFDSQLNAYVERCI